MRKRTFTFAGLRAGARLGLRALVLMGALAIANPVEAQLWNQTQMVDGTSTNRSATDRFGFSVDVDGNFAVVGAPYEDEDASGLNTLTSAGAAYVYEFTGGSWTLVATLMPSDRAASQNFGWDVAIDGDYIIVGAPGSMTTNPFAVGNIASGAAYIFENQSGSWTEVAKVMGSDRRNADLFGQSVDIDGDYAIVGAPDQDRNASNASVVGNAGAAYIFDGTSSWAQMQKIVASHRGPNGNDNFGHSVAISGDWVVVGAPNEDENAANVNPLAPGVSQPNFGAAYSFELSGGTWTETQKLLATNPAQGDLFGTAVDIDGSRIIVSAVGDDENEQEIPMPLDAGAVYVFDFSSGTWNKTAKIVAPGGRQSDRFGNAVSLYSNAIAVGAFRNDRDINNANSLTNAGSAYLFGKYGTEWTFVSVQTSANRETGAQFGYDLAIGNLIALVGAPNEDASSTTDAGAAYFYMPDMTFDIFTGTVSGDWNNSGNWFDGSVPTSVNSVLIPTGILNMPTLNSTGSAKHLLVANDASLDLNSGSTLNLYGDLNSQGDIDAHYLSTVVFQGSATQYIRNSVDLGSVWVNNSSGVTILSYAHRVAVYGQLTSESGTVTTAGNLVLASDATSSGQVVPYSGSGDNISGSVTVEEYMNRPAGWHAIASPVANQAASNLLDDISTLSLPSLYRFNEAKQTNTWEDGWEAMNSGDALTRGRGYYMFIPNFDVPTTISAFGNLYDGTTNVAAGHTNISPGVGGAQTGWNLMGNPYASGLDLQEVFDLNKTKNSGNFLFNTFYMYNPVNGQFGTYTASATTGANGTTANGGTRMIGPWQGFFMYAHNTNNLTMNNNMREFTTSRMLKTEASAESLVRLTVKDEAGRNDEALFFINGQVNAQKIRSLREDVPTLYTVNNGQEMIMNSMEVNGNVEVPVGVVSAVANTITISASIENLSAQYRVELEDKATGNFYALPIENLTVAYKEMEGERFILHISGGENSEIATEQTVSINQVYTRNDELVVSFTGDNGQALVTIMDVLGRAQGTQYVRAAGIQTMDVSSLQPGYYMVQVQAEGQVFTQKVLVK